MFNALTIPFSSQQSSAESTLWATIEQEYKESESKEAKIGDLVEMLSLVQNDLSAYNYIVDTCHWVVVDETNITVSLDIFVWPSKLDLAYSLDVDHGIVTTGVVLEEERGFDVVFNGGIVEVIPYIFEGVLTPSMPFISRTGKILPTPTITVSGSTVHSSEPIYCVLRAKGKVRGFRHTVVMDFVKAPGFKITNLRNTVTLSWVDENQETQSDIITLDIPKCVEDILAECPDGGPVADTTCFGRDCTNISPYLLVYFSYCTGDELQAKKVSK